MTALSRTLARVDSAVATILIVAFLGTGMVYAAGFAAAAHDTAHDSRHATAFPCH
jgi:cobalt transporter subunit CbtB